MIDKLEHLTSLWSSRLERVVLGPPAVVFVPAIVLGAYWFGDQVILLGVALFLPMLFLIIRRFSSDPAIGAPPRMPSTCQPHNIAVRAEETLYEARSEAGVAALLVMRVSGLSRIRRMHGHSVLERSRDRLLERARSRLRDGDFACWGQNDDIYLIVTSKHRLDLDLSLSIARRMQSCLEEELIINATSYSLTVAIGIALSNRLRPDADGAGFVLAAEAALTTAMASGGSAIRIQTHPLSRTPKKKTASSQVADALAALASGQIQPWFQPQLSTDTGDITGVEALARWCHPEKGTIPPGAFLAALEGGEALPALGHSMLTQSAAALKDWEKQGLHIPRVSLNMSEDELRNPKLCEKILWDIDNAGLTPDQFSFEILETVALASEDDVVCCNIRALCEHGFSVELDDFGTGNAAIAALQRYRVDRLKIDRSFITRLDRDEHQRKLVSGIIGMAEKLGLETVAEGVESHGEHAVLSQLGCTHVQGFRIARPMPADQLVGWAKSHAEKLSDIPGIHSKSA